MNSKQSQEQRLLEAALALEKPSERKAFLASIDDPALRQRLAELVAASTEADSFFRESPVANAGADSPGVAPPVQADLPPEESPCPMIGRYKLLEKIGEGGFGEVWMAEQREPVKRRVALKIIKLGMDSRQVVARFEAERQALAMMDHANIAKIFDADVTDTGRPYFVMELVRGIKITEYCDQKQLPTKERLDLFIKVCQAIQHAHQKGIIHRDIKPSNILVTLHDGVPVPKVIDFGIAKATQQELTDKTVFTQFQQFIGTPAYISPEQAEMSGLDIDTRADIYSLGVLLYELLVGQTPFDTKEMMQGGLDALRQIIREKEPLRPSTKLNTLQGDARTTAGKRRQTDVGKLVHQLQGDLDWIVMKCLEKDRTRRYETANGLASDIQRHLNNEAVLACPPSAAYRFQKAFRRNKLVFAAGIAVVLALVVGLGLAAVGLRHALAARAAEEVQRRQAQRAQTNEVQLRREAEGLALDARRRAYASDMNIAKQALDDNNLGRALDMLDQHRPKAGQTDLRGWEWRYLWSQTRSDALLTLCQETSEIRSLSVSSDGNLVAVSLDGRGGLSLWSVPDRREVLRLAHGEQNVCAVISPTEPLVAFTSIRFEDSGEQRSSLRLWNLATRQIITEKTLAGECKHLAIAADGGTLVTVTQTNSTLYTASGGQITLWRLSGGTNPRSYPWHNTPAGFAVTPDLRLAAVSAEHTRVIELKDGRELWNQKFGARTLAFSPDGKLLAGGGNEDICLWDTVTGQEVDRLVGHESGVNSLVFWPDGKKLASASSDRTIRIWDLPTRTCLDTLRGHRKQVGQVALMPDRQTLLSGCRDGSVCLWDTSVNHPPRQPRIDIQDVDAWAFEAGSKSVVTFNHRGRVTRWMGANFEIPEPLLETEPKSNNGFPLCFSSDGRRLGLGSDNLVEVWDVPRRVLWQRLTYSNGLVRAVKFFAKGNRLLTLSVKDGIIDDWDLTTASKVQSWPAPPLNLHHALSPDERHCVLLGFAGDVVLRDLTDKITTKLNLDIRKSHDGNYSPDGRWVAVPSDRNFARIWDAATWGEVKTLGGFSSDVWGTVFMPDGSRLAVTAAGAREAMRLYDTSNWVDTLTLEGEGKKLWPTMISPDGNVIGAGTLMGGRLQLWRAPSWEEIAAAEAKDPPSSDFGGQGKTAIKQP